MWKTENEDKLVAVPLRMILIKYIKYTPKTI